MKYIQFQIDEITYDFLQEEAKRYGIKRTELVADLCRMYMIAKHEELKEKLKKAEKGIAEQQDAHK